MHHVIVALLLPLLHSQEFDQAVVAQMNAHSGQVLTIEFHPRQANLLATGATDGEVLIWDLARPDAPTSKSPGAKVGHAAYVRWR